MLYRLSVNEASKLPLRAHQYRAVVMQHFPRFLAKDKFDVYLHTLAPERNLFKEFKEKDRLFKDHDGAFAAVDYEKRFSLSEKGREDLRRLCEISQEQDVYLICQCASKQRCHTDLLLLMAKKWFGAKTQYIRNSYPEFERRLAEGLTLIRSDE